MKYGNAPKTHYSHPTSVPSLSWKSSSRVLRREVNPRCSRIGISRRCVSKATLGARRFIFAMCSRQNVTMTCCTR